MLEKEEYACFLSYKGLVSLPSILRLLQVGIRGKFKLFGGYDEKLDEI